ncbi:Cobalt/zinc/cadmium efflux RND transporter, membrane fusion protein, CzcB family [hydrothermal vent metagenome]|uniref:Cobalt/zinc/cadmium efflux RND transporter, membrane fusion protein, CzcB family n=1 Tax=hydrothermal vent metagenome TaxID=652676 RepID=A0A3B1BXI8_9ZZZZ
MRIKILSIIFTGVIIVSGLGVCNAAEEGEKGHEVHDDHKDEGHKGHDDHKDEDKGHDEHGEEEVVRLTNEELKEFGIETAIVGPGQLKRRITLPGEIVVNMDKMAHIVPRVPGVVREVRKRLGDRVRAGEVLAILESRELSDAKAEYLAAHERLALAKANFEREGRLRKKKISSEQDYLNAKQALAEVQIDIRSAEQKLHALGFSEKYLKQLPAHSDTTYTRYEIKAPFNGTVIKKHITLGEMVKDDTTIFIIANLSTVWVNLSVYQKDLPFVHEGAKVSVIIGHGAPDVEGVISYLGPIVGEKTRTALARVVLPNKKGTLRPGLFISGKVTVEEIEVPVLIPKTALQTFEGKTVVFTKDEDGFEPAPVMIGRSDDMNVEIVSGLIPGQKYASKGAFTLKAQLSKGGFASGHNH